MLEFKKTKIVATIGPASASEETLEKMIEAGLNVARLNFSHGDHQEKSDKIIAIRAISEKLHIPVGIIADLQGPKIRLGAFDGIKTLTQGEKVTLALHPDSDLEIPMQFDLSKHLKETDRVFLNDGAVELKTTGISAGKITGIAQNTGIISSKKGINIPDTPLGTHAFTDKDKEDALFAISKQVDFVAISFVEDSAVVNEVREFLQKNGGGNIKIISKIERRKALDNLSDIITASDTIMVARGDLASETSPAEVPLWQREIVNLARQHQTPVIIATQMLESMIDNPRPTRAETSDVANAVFSESDAVMLSAESATGKYPVDVIKTMSDIIISVENHKEYKHYIRINWEHTKNEELQFNALTSAAASLAYRLGVKTIVAATASGRTARLLSSFRPSANIVAVTHSHEVQHQLTLVWGVTPIIVPPEPTTDSFWHTTLESMRHQNLVSTSEKLVLVTGSGSIGTPGATDTLKII